jgi:hypothetical protein
MVIRIVIPYQSLLNFANFYASIQSEKRQPAGISPGMGPDCCPSSPLRHKNGSRRNAEVYGYFGISPISKHFGSFRRIAVSGVRGT